MQASIRLRRAVVERSVKGSAESRDSAINMFLEEIHELFTERLIDSLSDEVLGGMFVDWLSSIGKLGREERIKALTLDARLSPIPFTLFERGYVDTSSIREEPEVSGNVVSLHAR